MTPYEILGVAADATEAELKAAYRRRVFETHPDRGGDAKQFRAVQDALDAIARERGDGELPAWARRLLKHIEAARGAAQHGNISEAASHVAAFTHEVSCHYETARGAVAERLQRATAVKDAVKRLDVGEAASQVASLSEDVAVNWQRGRGIVKGLKGLLRAVGGKR